MISPASIDELSEEIVHTVDIKRTTAAQFREYAKRAAQDAEDYRQKASVETNPEWLKVWIKGAADRAADAEFYLDRAWYAEQFEQSHIMKEAAE